VTHIPEEPAAPIFKAEGKERKSRRNFENYPANYTTSYPILTTMRTSKLTKQQSDTVQLNEESKKREKDRRIYRQREGRQTFMHAKSVIL